MRHRVLVVGEHELLRLGIATILQSSDSFSVQEGLVRPCAALRQIAATNPHIVILDPFQPAARELNLLAEIRDRFADMRVLVLTDSTEAVNIDRAIQLRVNGYLLQSSPGKDLLSALEAIVAGRTYLHPDVSHALVTRELRAAPGYRAPGTSGNGMLTVRQEQVLRMIADGKTTQQMASSLGLSAKTIESHRVMLMNRLGIHHIPGLVRYALRHGYANLMAANDG